MTDARRHTTARSSNANSGAAPGLGPHDGGTPQPAVSGPTPMPVAEYTQRHGLHRLLDKMVRDIVAEKPPDSSRWMLRWFLEQHRLQCEERHRFNSPPQHAKVPHDAADADAGGDAGEGSAEDEATSGHPTTVLPGHSSCTPPMPPLRFE